MGWVLSRFFCLQKNTAFSPDRKAPCQRCRPRAYDEYVLQVNETMAPAEPKRNFFQTAVYNFFALYLGITPPAPGQEGFYAALLLGVAVVVIGLGYLIVRFLFNQMLG